MGSVDAGSGMPREWRGLCSSGEWRTLNGALSEHTLYELAQILTACDDSRVRGLILEAVLDALPGYGDRSVLVALARVAHPAPEQAGRA